VVRDWTSYSSQIKKSSSLSYVQTMPLLLINLSEVIIIIITEYKSVFNRKSQGYFAQSWMSRQLLLVVK
jgi:hypothetical protein